MEIMKRREITKLIKERIKASKLSRKKEKERKKHSVQAENALVMYQFEEYGSRA